MIDLSVIAAERRGDYLGKTVQVIPHITDEIFAAFEPALARANVFLCTQDVRRYLRQLLRTRRRDVVVLGYGEMFDGVDFDVIGTVAVGHGKL